MFIPPLLLS